MLPFTSMQRSKVFVRAGQGVSERCALPSSAIAHQRRLKRSESTQGEVGEAVTGEVHQKRLGSRACGTQTALKTDRGVLRHTWTPGQKISKTGSSQLQAGTPPGGHRGCSKISHHQANSSLSLSLSLSFNCCVVKVGCHAQAKGQIIGRNNGTEGDLKE
jgi:hypothetical protein